MKTFKNKWFTGKRNPECTNKIACKTESAPNHNWIECDESILSLPGVQKLYSETADGQTVQYFGWL